MTNPHGTPPPAEPERTIPGTGPAGEPARSPMDAGSFPAPPGPYPTQAGQFATRSGAPLPPPAVPERMPAGADPLAPAGPVMAGPVRASPVTAGPVTATPYQSPGGPEGVMPAYFDEHDPQPGYGEPPEDPRRKGTIIASIIVGIVVAAAGLGIGVLWTHIAPRVGVIKVAQGFVYADSEPEQAVAADAWFALLGLGAGLVFAGLAWFVLRRYRGVALMAGLVLGSLVGAWLAWWLGIRIGMHQFDAVRDTVALGTRVDAPLVLRLTDLDRHALWPPKPTGVIAAQALAAAITYTVLAAFSINPGLRPPRRSEETDSASSDPDAPAGPPA